MISFFLISLMRVALLGSVEMKDCGGGEEGRWMFQSCMWFSGVECAYSCNRGAYKLERDEDLCPDEWIGYACYCWNEY